LHARRREGMAGSICEADVEGPRGVRRALGQIPLIGEEECRSSGDTHDVMIVSSEQWPMCGRRIGAGALVGKLRVVGGAIARPLWHAYLSTWDLRSRRAERVAHRPHRSSAALGFGAPGQNRISLAQGRHQLTVCLSRGDSVAHCRTRSRGSHANLRPMAVQGSNIGRAGNACQCDAFT
jgi:hypothetical protein